MKQLLIDREFSCAGVGRNLFIVQPPLEYGDLTRAVLDVSGTQGFAWYPNGVFFPFRYGNGWLTIYQSDLVLMDEKSSRAIMLPFEVPSEGYLTVGGDLEGTELINLHPGQYALLYELRALTLDEVVNIEKYQYAFDYCTENDFPGRAPELCTLTFVPAQEKVNPELLKFSSWRSNFRGEVQAPPEELIMFDEPAEEAY